MYFSPLFSRSDPAKDEVRCGKLPLDEKKKTEKVQYLLASFSGFTAFILRSHCPPDRHLNWNNSQA